MKACSIFLLLISIVVLGTMGTAEHHPLSDEFIAETNKKATTWVAERQFDISDWDLVQKLANGVSKISRNPNWPIRTHGLSASEIPESFDSAENWPECESIREIRDQSRCGSCWAVAAVEAMSDRICIHSNSTLQTRVSATDLTTCCSNCGTGCGGGTFWDAWVYWEETGIVTGGLYNDSAQGCQAYFLPECEDHPTMCRNYVATPQCNKKCDNPDVDFNSSLTFGIKKSAAVFDKVEDIQAEIMKNGPVETAMNVLADFINYKSGIYQPTTDHSVGGHAVKIVGWGVENGVKYWKIANSWNARWGENGYFRILRGVNAAIIETVVAAGLPKLD